MRESAGERESCKLRPIALNIHLTAQNPQTQCELIKISARENEREDEREPEETIAAS